MAKPFSNLRNNMSPRARARAARQTAELLLEMNLRELREDYAKQTQAMVAAELDVSQAAVSQFEGRTDVTIRKLAEWIAVLGAKLEIHARFENGDDVRITQFDDDDLETR